MITWILFTGAPQTGKSSACKMIQTHLDTELGTKMGYAAVIRHPMKPLIRPVQEIFGAGDMPYEQFKATHFYGITGRQWLISVVDGGLRSLDTHITTKILRDEILDMKRAGNLTNVFVLVESVGFFTELEYYKQFHNFSAERVVHVHMDREGHDYSRDSREDLRMHADVKAELPTVLPMVIQKLDL